MELREFTSHPLFYSKEKLVTDGNYPNEYGGYAPLKRVWPNLSFQLQYLGTEYRLYDGKSLHRHQYFLF